MRKAFAHEALLRMRPDGDSRAPGAAITLELCGHWEHDPPCPLAPHHTHADRRDGEVELRILFAVEPEREDSVRQRIDRALARGDLPGVEDGTTWQLILTRVGAVSPAEQDHASRLTGG